MKIYAGKVSRYIKTHENGAKEIDDMSSKFESAEFEKQLRLLINN